MPSISHLVKVTKANGASSSSKSPFMTSPKEEITECRHWLGANSSVAMSQPCCHSWEGGQKKYKDASMAGGSA